MAIVAAPRLARNSIVVRYDTRLVMRANIADIYTYKTGLYNRENQSWPEDAIKVKIKDNSATEVVVTLKNDLVLPGVYGQIPAVGTEEPPTTMDYHCYQANYRKVIPKPGYGLRKLEAEKYKLYEEHENSLGLWAQEEHGIGIRHAILERISPNLTVGDTAGTIAAWWNPNIFIPTVGILNQPVFNVNRATHTNNIVQGLINSGGLGQFAARTATATFFEDISNWALNPRRLKKLKIAGLPTGEGFVLTVSELQAAMLSNPIFAANNLGSLWIARDRLPGPIQKWPGVIGSYNDILVIVDPRQPTVLPGGSSAPFSMVAGYMVWGSRDLRHRRFANCKDTAFLLGNGAFLELEGEPLHYIADDRDYKLHQGLGIAGVRGDMLPIFIDPTDNTNTLLQTCAVALLDLPNGGTLST
jgi:hypothetical protein